jgi:broad specificity phosphatase PhoE
MPMHILLLRHGETDANAAGILQGHLQTHLNATGRAQTAKLADRLGGFEPRLARLLSSDLPRAVESAEPIATRVGLPIEVDAAWRERSYGALEGVDPARREALQGSMTDEAIGAEPIPRFERRVEAALRAIAATFPSPAARASDRSVAVMTHGGVIRRALRILLEGKLPSRGELPALAPVLNASIFHLTWDGEAFRSVAFNDDSHLGAAPPRAMDVD